jgi:hypothetical protein
VSVTEIGALHGRWMRLSDRFKALWTYHQFASGVYRNLIREDVPYHFDFHRTYEQIKGVPAKLNASEMSEAAATIAHCESALDRAAKALLAADERVPPSLVRRFFEKLKRHDDNIIHFLIKFYLYSDAVIDDRRDKVDFLFTRIGEDYHAASGEFASRDSLEFRERILALVSARQVTDPAQDEVTHLIRAIRSMRDEILGAVTFDELTERNLLKNARTFKHRIGDLYFHPDVLIAAIELNVTAKNRFLRLYHEEESRILDDAEKLLEHGPAIERNFGDSNPELAGEMARFRDFKEKFDTTRAQSNVKHDLIAQLKASMSNILAQLDSGVVLQEDVGELPRGFFDAAQQNENVTDRFGGEEVLLRFLSRIAAAVHPVEPGLTPDELATQPAVRELRLEAWEATSYEKLFERRKPEAEEDTEELWMLYLRAAALRIKVDEEATILATALAAGVRPDNELLTKAKQSLDTAKELDEQFGDFLHEAVYYSNARFLHQLYRSRFRLLRGFSGLWLIYDRQS